MSVGGRPPHPNLSPDTTLADLDAAWLDREREAAHLAAAGFRSMATALRCYALEIRIKAMICRRLNLELLPKACRTHDLMEIIIFTGLWAELSDPVNDRVEKNWELMVAFSRRRLNLLRYQPAAILTDVETNEIDAALDDPQVGVLAWLSRPR